MILNLTGIGAVRLETQTRTILIDAYNTLISPPGLNPGDLVLFTHSDADHFSPAALLPKLHPETTIIGPPGIVKPLWDSGQIEARQVICPYPCDYTEPERLEYGEITLKIFNTDHFIGWHNQHVSFLVEAEDKRIYITGDSDIRPENISELSGIDVLVASILIEETVKETMDRRHAEALTLCRILDLRRRVKPKKLIVNHLIGCDWAADPAKLKALIERNGLDDVSVPLNPDEVVPL